MRWPSPKVANLPFCMVGQGETRNFSFENASLALVDEKQSQSNFYHSTGRRKWLFFSLTSPSRRRLENSDDV